MLDSGSVLAAVALDQVRVRGAEDGENQPGQAGTAAEIDEPPGAARPEPPELTAVQDVPPPRIGQGGTADEVDRDLPAREQLEIDSQPLDCYT